MSDVKKNFTELFDIYAANILNEAMVKPLADELGVSTDSLLKLGLGYHLEGYSHAYVNPERDSQGNIIGLTQRYPDGKKIVVKGSKRGLIYEVNPEFLVGGERYVSGADNWQRVSKSLLCPVCGKDNGCAVSAENIDDPKAVMCVHIAEGSVKPVGLGHLHILKPEGKINNSQSILPATDKPIIMVEGHSDTAAAMDLGFVAIGRPSAESGQPALIPLVRGQEVIIVGDNDEGVGKKGMESVFYALSPICKKVTKVLPPTRFKDLRQWKNQLSLTETSFLEWVQENGDTGGDSNILEDNTACSIAKTWLEKEKTQDGFLTVGHQHSQWVQYVDGHYVNYSRENIEDSIWLFVDGKKYPKVDIKGGINLVPYVATRTKVLDIVAAARANCSIKEDPPVWLDEKWRVDNGYPEPANLIPFKNGLLDINEYIKGKIKFHNPTPTLYDFNILPYDFDEDAHSDLWEDFINDTFNEDKDQIRLLKQWFGYCCVPDMSLQKLMFFVGRPRSGKGNVLRTLEAMLGKEQCASEDFQHLASGFGYDSLMGKLIVVLNDVRISNKKEATAGLGKILQIVGGDSVGINRKNKDNLPQVFLQTRITMAMNELPRIPDQANALGSRLLVLSFPNSYKGREKTELTDALKKEARKGRVINSALWGLKDLRQSGEFIVSRQAKSIMEDLEGLTTPISVFIKDCCEMPTPDVSPENYSVRKDQLFEAWIWWCAIQNIKDVGTKEKFCQGFKSACPSAETRRIASNTYRSYCFIGVRLSDYTLQQISGSTAR